MTTYNRIGAVKTNFAILRYLADQREPVSGQDVAKALGLPHPTVMCHLATLEDENIIRQVGGAYELGIGLALFHARYRAMLEGRVTRINDELNQLEV